MDGNYISLKTALTICAIKLKLNQSMRISASVKLTPGKLTTHLSLIILFLFCRKMRTILVKDTMGQLGNKMFCLANLYMFSVKYGFDAYTTNTVLDDLRYIFEGVDGKTNKFIIQSLNYKNLCRHKIC